MSMLDSLFGIQRVFVNAVEMVTRKRLDLFGVLYGVDDPATGATRVYVGLRFTPVKTGSYAAAYGELVRISSGGTVTLPLAANQQDGRVAVLLTADAAVTVVASGADTIEWGALGFTTKNEYVELQSDGASKWWVVGMVD